MRVPGGVDRYVILLRRLREGRIGIRKNQKKKVEFDFLKKKYVEYMMEYEVNYRSENTETTLVRGPSVFDRERQRELR